MRCKLHVAQRKQCRKERITLVIFMLHICGTGMYSVYIAISLTENNFYLIIYAYDIKSVWNGLESFYAISFNVIY